MIIHYSFNLVRANEVVLDWHSFEQYWSTLITSTAKSPQFPGHRKTFDIGQYQK